MADVSLELIQAMLQRVLDVQATHTRDFQDLKSRMTTLEQSILSMRRDALIESEARIHGVHEIDGLKDRVARIERRLELAEAPR